MFLLYLIKKVYINLIIYFYNFKALFLIMVTHNHLLAPRHLNVIIRTFRYAFK
jgi:hypothetical protein